MSRIVILGFLLFITVPLFADNSDIDIVYKLAHKISGLPLASNPPTVIKVPLKKLMVVCSKPCPTIKAAQVGNTILVLEDLDMKEIKNLSILFHEMVHYLQWANSGLAKSCDEWVDREISAYQLQNQMLYKSGSQTVQPPSLIGVCKDGK